VNDKKALLGELQLDSDQREAGTRGSRFFLLGIIAILAVAAGWFWFKPPVDPISIKTVQAHPATGGIRSTSSAILDASGYVTARRQATVSSKFTGKVIEVFIEEGMVVEAGQLLARLDKSTQQAQYDLSVAQLRAAISRLEEVKVQRQEAQLDLKRSIELTEKKLASEAELDRARLAVEGLDARLKALQSEIEVGRSGSKVQQQLLSDTEIRAPFAGVVIAKSAQPGEMISPVSAGGGFTRTGICTIVDMDSLEIEVDVNESYINRVMPNQPVTATLNSYQDWKIPAKVITIIPTADRNKATVRVRIAFLETDARILPDMGVKVSFLEEQIEEPVETELTGVFIPGNSIVSVDDETVVLVVKNESVEMRPIKVGQRNGNTRNVVSGLSSGEEVVTHLTSELLTALNDGQPFVTDGGIE